MSQIENVYYDPETVEVLRTALEDAWASLPKARQAQTSKSVLAERVLRLAATGERDPKLLRAAALSGRVG